MGDPYEIVTITIGENKIDIDMKETLGGLPDRDEPLRIGEYGALLGDAEEERIKLEGMYRKWRGEQGNEFRRRDKTLPEWRVKQKIEAQDAFLNYKHAEAACERNCIILRNVICALLAKTGIRDPNVRITREE